MTLGEKHIRRDTKRQGIRNGRLRGFLINIYGDD